MEFGSHHVHVKAELQSAIQAAVIEIRSRSKGKKKKKRTLVGAALLEVLANSARITDSTSSMQINTFSGLRSKSDHFTIPSYAQERGGNVPV